MSRRDPRDPLGDHTVILPRRWSPGRGLGRMRAVAGVNRLIRIVCGVFIAILLVHAALVLFRAGFDNTFTALVRDWAAWLSLGLRELFTFDDGRLRVVAGDGAAALLWWIVANLLTAIIARVFVPGFWRSFARRR